MEQSRDNKKYHRKYYQKKKLEIKLKRLKRRMTDMDYLQRHREAAKAFHHREKRRIFSFIPDENDIWELNHGTVPKKILPQLKEAIPGNIPTKIVSVIGIEGKQWFAGDWEFVLKRTGSMGVYSKDFVPCERKHKTLNPEWAFIKGKYVFLHPVKSTLNPEMLLCYISMGKLPAISIAGNLYLPDFIMSFIKYKKTYTLYEALRRHKITGGIIYVV